MKRTKHKTRFTRTRIGIGSHVEYKGEYYWDTGVVDQIQKTGDPTKRRIWIAWNHDPDKQPFGGTYGTVPESKLTLLQ